MQMRVTLELDTDIGPPAGGRAEGEKFILNHDLERDKAVFSQLCAQANGIPCRGMLPNSGPWNFCRLKSAKYKLKAEKKSLARYPICPTPPSPN